MIAREDRPGDKRLVGMSPKPIGARWARRSCGPRWRSGCRPIWCRLRWWSWRVAVDGQRQAGCAVLAGPEYQGTTYRAPSTATEETLAGIYAQVLGVERVRADDSFFDLGGIRCRRCGRWRGS